MNIFDAIQERHSVRSYMKKEIPDDIAIQLKKEIQACNIEGKLHIQLITNEPKAFDGFMARYGKFSGVQNYIALIGKQSSGLEEKLGYYGERIALFAQTLGLNTCWVAMSFRKSVTKHSCQINADEKLVCVLALGYGLTSGVQHRSKSIEEVCSPCEEMPQWYKRGIQAALLAPTAMNQQKFLFSFSENIVSVKSTGGFYSKVDLGIAKYHFEIGAGKDHFKWKKA
ncbi:MAG: nitroreductase family protein [Candidatus Howiella sp.]|jgi:hypothetical protein